MWSPRSCGVRRTSSSVRQLGSHPDLVQSVRGVPRGPGHHLRRPRARHPSRPATRSLRLTPTQRPDGSKRVHHVRARRPHPKRPLDHDVAGHGHRRRDVGVEREGQAGGHVQRRERVVTADCLDALFTVAPVLRSFLTALADPVIEESPQRTGRQRRRGAAATRQERASPDQRGAGRHGVRRRGRWRRRRASRPGSAGHSRSGRGRRRCRARSSVEYAVGVSVVGVQRQRGLLAQDHPDGCTAGAVKQACPLT